MERETAVEGREHLLQPIQCEPAEIRVANAREVRRRETGRRIRLATRSSSAARIAFAVPPFPGVILVFPV